MKFRCAVVFAAALAPGVVLADDYIPPVVAGHTYVQHQIEEAKARHPEIASIIVTGKRDKTNDIVILGSTLGASSVFQKASMPALPDGSWMSKPGRMYVVREAFNSNSGHRLGTITVSFTKQPKQNDIALMSIAKEVQAELGHATLSTKNAVDPYPYSAAYAPNTMAQALTDKFVRAHPDLLVMMIHATPPGGSKNVIIGSNIGRIGKEADEDDLRVIEKGSTNLEIGGDEDRFETELPLNDATGTRIGALGLVFAYKAGQDKESIHAHGIAIRDELAREIPSNAALFSVVN